MSQPINDGGPALEIDEVIPYVIVRHDLFNLRNAIPHKAGKPAALHHALSICADEIEREEARKKCPKQDRIGQNGGKFKDGLQRVQSKDELVIKGRSVNRCVFAAQSRRINGVALQGVQHSACDFRRRFVLHIKQVFSCLQRLQPNTGTGSVLQRPK
jgi:hypothetical protein